jgi:hypothetical protein
VKNFSAEDNNIISGGGGMKSSSVANRGREPIVVVAP